MKHFLHNNINNKSTRKMCYLGVNMLKMMQVKLKRAKEIGKNCW